MIHCISDRPQGRKEIIMEKTNEKKLLTVKDVAELLQISPSCVYALIHANVLPALKLKSFKIRPEAVDKFLADNEGKDLSDPYNITMIAESVTA